MKITYTIPKNWEITEAEATLIKDMYREGKDMYREGQRVLAIKFIRSQYPELGLHDAKQLCDVVAKPG